MVHGLWPLRRADLTAAAAYGGLLLAGASLAILPVVAIFAIIGKWFVAGLTEGAVK